MLKKQNIKTKLAIYIVFTTLITTFIISLISIIITSRNTLNEALTKVSYEANIIQLELNKGLTQISSRVDDLGYIIENSFIVSEATNEITSDAYMKDYMELIYDLVLTSSTAVDGNLDFYVVFNPNVIKADEDDLYSAIVILDGESNYVKLINEPKISDLDSDNPSHQWFFEPQRTKTSVWLTPYHDEFVDSYIFSYVTPVYINGEYIAVVGADIDFNYFISSKQFEEEQLGDVYLFDENLNIYRHPSIKPLESLEKYDPNYHLVLSDIIDSDSSSYYEYEDFRGVHYFSYAKLLNNWVITINPKSNIIFSSVYRFIGKLIILNAIGVICAFLIANVISIRISGPLKQIKENFEKLSNKDFDISSDSIKLLKYNDEIGNLASAFYDMHTDQIQLIQTVKDSSKGFDNISGEIDDKVEILYNLSSEHHYSLNQLEIAIKTIKDNTYMSTDELIKLYSSHNPNMKSIKDIYEEFNLLLKKLDEVPKILDEYKKNHHFEDDLLTMDTDLLANTLKELISKNHSLIEHYNNIYSLFDKYHYDIENISENIDKYTRDLEHSFSHFTELTANIEESLALVETISDTAFNISVENGNINHYSKSISNKSKDINKLISRYHL